MNGADLTETIIFGRLFIKDGMIFLNIALEYCAKLEYNI